MLKVWSPITFDQARPPVRVFRRIQRLALGVVLLILVFAGALFALPYLVPERDIRAALVHSLQAATGADPQHRRRGAFHAVAAAGDSARRRSLRRRRVPSFFRRARCGRRFGFCRFSSGGSRSPRSSSSTRTSWSRSEMTARGLSACRCACRITMRKPRDPTSGSWTASRNCAAPVGRAKACRRSTGRSPGAAPISPPKAPFYGGTFPSPRLC